MSKFFELQCVKSLVLQNNTMVAGKELGGLHVFTSVGSWIYLKLRKKLRILNKIKTVFIQNGPG